MFTGLIREIGRVKGYGNNILSISSQHPAKIGDSIAVNGICLTVIKTHPNGFELELADETRSIIDESKLKGEVHIEPAMQLSDRFEGHILQGHIDCIGEVLSITKRTNGVDYIIGVEPRYTTYIVPKGSIAIDGVSLTVNDVYESSFRLTIIPHTLNQTLIRHYIKGTKVNIETDLFARYLEHILVRRLNPKKSLDWSDIDAISMGY